MTLEKLPSLVLSNGTKVYIRVRFPVSENSRYLGSTQPKNMRLTTLELLTEDGAEYAAAAVGCSSSDQFSYQRGRLAALRKLFALDTYRALVNYQLHLKNDLLKGKYDVTSPEYRQLQATLRSLECQLDCLRSDESDLDLTAFYEVRNWESSCMCSIFRETLLPFSRLSTTDREALMDIVWPSKGQSKKQRRIQRLLAQRTATSEVSEICK